MKFLRIAIDTDSCTSLCLVREGSQIYMYRRVNHKQNLKKIYNNATKALKDFDYQVGVDYNSLGIYYDSFNME